MKAVTRAEKRKTTLPRKRRGTERPLALFRLVVRVSSEHGDLAGAVLVHEGAGGAMQDETPRDARLTCFGESEQSLKALGRAVTERLASIGVPARSRVTRAPRAFEGWRTAWTRTLEPVRISETTWLAPTTRPAPDEPGATVIWLEPAMSFGFGEHPTTRMAARVVERLCRDGARTILDFGSGSGVLSLVAVRAGASRAVGIDVDPIAVEAARRNARLNGSERQSRYSRASLARISSRFDVVVANVDGATLQKNAASLSARVAMNGNVVLTGFLRADVRDVARPFRALGFRIAERVNESDYALLVLRAKA
jgi:ribosomal protein L11 methyltransferase